MCSRSAGKTFVRIVRRDDLDLLRLRPENAHHQVIARAMRTEHPERIGVRAVQERGDFVRVEG